MADEEILIDVESRANVTGLEQTEKALELTSLSTRRLQSAFVGVVFAADAFTRSMTQGESAMLRALRAVDLLAFSFGGPGIGAAVSIGAGTAELELQSDTRAATDTLSFSKKGHITFGSTSDIFGINGGIFTLVDSVKGLAKAAEANPSGAFALANSYDAGADKTYTASPIPTLFNGMLEGLGNDISNLSIRDTSSSPR